MKSYGRISVAKIYNGSDSISVSITANSQVFISYDKGETFTPEIVKLTPNCQGGANFKSWQYSTDNGATWKTIGNNTHDCTIDSTTHILSIKHSSDIFGVGNMVSIRANIIESDKIYDVFSIAKIYDGSTMTDGYNSEIVYLYKRSKTVPTIDWKETLNYNFTIKGLTSIPNGWSATIPDGSDSLYVTSASAFSREIVDDIEPEEWTTPVLYKDTRSVTQIENKYKVSSLSEGVKTSDNGWVNEIPEMTADKKYLWNYQIISYDKAPLQEITTPKVIGIYGGNGSSVSYQVGDSGTAKPEGEWSANIPEVPDGKYLWTKIIMQQADGSFTEAYSVSYKGISGSDGLNNATVYLYQRAKSTPAAPSSNVTYNFSTHIATGVDITANKWRQTIPDGSDPIYITTATALGTEELDIIESSEWATPTILSQNGSSVSIKRTSITYQVGFSGTNKPTNDAGWTETIPETEAGKYLWTKTVVEYSDGTVTESYSVSYRSLDGTDGEDGRGVANTSISYQVSDSGTEKPTTWKPDIPEVPAGKYLWTKTVITYTDGKSSEIFSVSRNAKDGNNGKGISKVTEYYLASNSSKDVTIKDTGWDINVPTITKEKRYLWNYEKTTYTDTTETSTIPAVIGVYGESGVGIKSISNYYKISDKNIGITNEDTDWSDTPMATTPNKPYLWNYELTVFSDTTTSKTKAHIIGTHGMAGVSVINVENLYLATSKDLDVTVDEKGWSVNVKDHPLTSINKYLWNYEKTTLSDKTVKTTDPCIIGMYTEDGKGIDNITEQYAVSDSATSIPLESEWKDKMQTMTAEKRYLWNRETISYTDKTSHTTDAKVIGVYGDKGDDGTSVVKVINKYLATNESIGVTDKTTGWTNTVQTTSESKKYLWNYEVTVLSNGTEQATEPCIIGIYSKDGKGISKIVEKYAVSDSNITVPTTWSDVVQTMTAEKRYLWNYEIITYTDESTKETDARVIGVYGRDGKNGVSVVGVDNKYLASSKSTGITIEDNKWSDTVQPLDSTNKYLWNYEITRLSDNTNITTDPCVIGTYSVDGVGIDHIQEQYAVSNSNASAPAEAQWKDTVQQMTTTNRYLWNREKIYYTNNLNKPSISDARIIGVYGETGKDGKGISSIVTHYLATSVSDGVTKDTTGWKETAQRTTSTNKYLWSYQTITYTDKTVDNTVPVIIGVYGEKGDSITIKSTSVTYQLASSGTEEPTGAWLSYVPDSGSGDYLWTKTTVVYSDGTEINSFGVSYNGVNAKEGYETDVIYLYKRSKTVPTIDWTEDLTYSFITNKLDKEPKGWSQTTPSGSDTLYVTTATAFAQTITDTIAYTEWTTPIVYNKVRTNTKIENFYIASNKSEGITLSTSGWSTDIPTTDAIKKYLWTYAKYTYDMAPLTETTDPKIIAIYGGNGSSVTYQVGNSGTEKPTGTWLDTIPTVPDGKYLWTKIVMILSDGKTNESYSVSYKGKDGVNGINTATVYLYKRSDTIPDKPSKNITYNFETSGATGEEISTGVWYLSVPSGNKPLYVITATAASTENTDIILPSEWSTPQILSKNGESISIESSSVEYQIGISGTERPTNDYGWSKDVPEVSQGQFLWSRTTVNYSDGTNTVSYNVSYIGNDGVSITEVINWYLATDKDTGVTISTKGWDQSVANTPLTSTNKYLWNYEETIFSDGKNKQTEPCIIGTYAKDGKNGVGISGITEKYAVSDSNETAPTTWYDTVQKMTSTNKYLWNYEIISYTDNSTPHTTKPRVIGVYGDKGEDGKSIVSIINYYLATNAASNVTKDTSGWTTTIQTVSKDKKYLWNYEVTTFSKGENNVTTPCIIGMYGENGKDGVGISGVKEQYYASSSSTTVPTESQWKDSVQQMTSTNKFLWNREIITYTDKTTHTTDAKIIGIYGDKGDKGDNGKSVTKITNYYLATSAAKDITRSTSGWTTSIQSTDANKKYLWNYEKTEFSEGDPTYTDPCIIGTFASDGISITGVKEQYCVSSKNTAPAESDWKDSVQQMTATNKYLWNREIISYSGNKANTITDPRIIGVYGEKGIDGVSVTNIVTHYLATSAANGITRSTSGWTTSIQSTDSTKKYLWSYQTFNKSSGSPTETDPCIIGTYGQKGDSVTIKSTSITYQKSTSGTETPDTWVEYIPDTSAGEYLWTKTTVTYSDGTSTDSYSVAYNGMDVKEGYDTAVIYLFKRSSTTPTVDWKDTLTYDFANSKLNKIPTGWSTTVPSGSDTLYVTTATAFSKELTDDIAYTEWTTPMVYKQTRTNTKIENFYIVSDKSSGITTSTTGWSTTIPNMTNDKKYLWMYEKYTYDIAPLTEIVEPKIISIYGGNGSSVTYQVGNSGTEKPTGTWLDTIPTVPDGKYLWTKIVITLGDGKTNESYSVSYKGQDGNNGLNTATIYLYTRSTETPSKPTADITYNFKTHEVTGTDITNKKWNVSIPDGSNPIYVITGTALSQDTTDIIPTSEWSEPQILSQNGTSVTITETSVTYQIGISGTSKPTNEAGWVTEVPEVSQGQFLWTRTIVKYSDGQETTSYSVSYHGNDGVSVSNVVNWYLASSKSNGVKINDSGWNKDVSQVSLSSENKYLWNYEETELSNGSTHTTDPCVIGTYGDDGVGIDHIDEQYKASNSNTVAPTEWKEVNVVDTMTATNKYLWNREIIHYTNETSHTSTPKVIGVYGDKGEKGDNGKSVVKITNYYLATSADKNITRSTSGWTTTVQTTDATKKYLWNYEKTEFSEGDPTYTDPCIIGIYSSDGISITGVKEQYCISSTNAAPKESDWKDSIQTMTSTNKYLWNREIISYSGDKANTITEPRIIGVYGDKGADGVSVTSIVTHYLATSAANGVTKDTSGWTTTVQTTDANKKYLWSYQTFNKSSGNPEETSPCIIGTFGQKGESVTIKSTSITYQKSASGTETPSTWVEYIPDTSAGEYLWTKTTVTYSDGTHTDSYSVAYNGVNVKEGYESAVIYLFKRATSTPSIDWKDTITYDFVEGTLNKVPSGWSTTIPSGTNTLYVTTASAFSMELTDNIAYTEWTTPMVYKQTRTNTKIENFYLASDKTEGITTSTTGWSTTVPNMTNTNKYLWMYEKYTYDMAPLTETTEPKIISIYGGNGSSVTYQVGNSGTEKPTGTWLNTVPTIPDGKYLWTKIVISLGDGKVSESYSVSYKGIDGNNGLNTATIYLYKRFSVKPSKPTSDIIYNFKTHEITGDDITNNKWFVSIPDGTAPIYVITGTALSQDITDVIPTSEWSDPQILSQNGTSVTISETSVTYQIGISGTTKPTNEAGWVTEVPEVKQGQFLWTRTVVKYSDGQETTSYSVSYHGNDGISITDVVNWYLASSKSDGIKINDSGWNKDVTKVPLTSTNKYLWNYEETILSDGSTRTTDPCIIGTYGDDGVGIDHIDEEYKATNSSTTPPTEWGKPNVVDTMTSTNRYLWNREKVYYTNNLNNPKVSAARVIGVYGDTGKDGNGIKQITNYYLATSAANGVSTSTTGWTTTVQKTTATNKYLWNYQLIEYTDSSVSSKIVGPCIIGTYGDKGDKGDSITITSQSVTYVASSSGTDQPTTGWQTTIPELNAGEYLWTKTTVVYSDGTKTESFSVSYNGINAKEGYESAVIYLYKRSTSTPSIDWKDTLYYDFSTSKLDKIPSGWSDTVPSGSNTLYVTTASAFSKTITDDIACTEWTTPVAYKNTRTNTKIENFYLVSDKSSGITTSTTGWSTTIPNMTNTNKYLWSYKKYTYDIAPLTEITTPEIISIYGGNGSSVTYQVGDSGVDKPTGTWLNTIPEVPDGKYLWTKIVILLNDGQVNESYSVSYKGIDGNDGLNTATVYLYKRSASVPAKPTTAVTYNFKTKTLTGTDISSGNWSVTIPSGSTPIYIINATAANVGETDVIEATEWSTPQILSQNGTSVSVDRSIVEYQVGISGTSKPTNDAGWSTTMPEVPKGKFLWTRTTVYYTDGKSTISYAVSYQGVDGLSAHVVNHYLATSAKTGVTISTTGWTESIAEQNFNATNRYLWNYEESLYSDNTPVDKPSTPVIISVYTEDGKSIEQIEEKYAASSSNKNAPEEKDFESSIPELNATTHKYLWNYEIIHYIKEGVTSTSTTDKRVIGAYGDTGSKGDKGDKGEPGATGVGIKEVEEYYLATNASSNVTTSTDGWDKNATTQIINENKRYLWNYERIHYTDDTYSKPTTPVIIGTYGKDGTPGTKGRGISRIDNFYKVSSISDPSKISINDSDWGPANEMRTTTETNKYLWNYEKITYTEGDPSYTQPRIIGTHGTKGSNGTSITISGKSIKYAVNSSGTSYPTTESDWKDTIPTVDNGQFLWTRTTVNYSDGTSTVSYTVSYKAKDGTKGEPGTEGKGYTILLSNESHTFVYANGASTLNSGQSTSTSIKAWKNTASSNVTLTKIGTTTVSGNGTFSYDNISYTVSGNGTTNILVTITPTANAALTGAIDFVISVDGLSFTKTFTYTSTCPGKKGDDGDPGTPGKNAYSVHLVSSSQIFKSSDGGVTFTPSTITITPVFQNCSYSKWQLSTNGGSTWYDISNTNGISINSSTHALTISNSSGKFTKNVTAISFKCVSNVTNVSDVVTIAKIYDVNDLVVGGRNFLSLITGEIGYCLCDYKPITNSDGDVDTTQCLDINVDSNNGWITIFGKNNYTNDKIPIYYVLNRSDISLSGGTYTLSVDKKNNSTIKYQFIVSVQSNDENETTYTLGPNESKLTFSVDQNTTIQYIYLSLASNTVISEGDAIKFRCQLEEGIIATDWKLDPFDTNHRYMESRSDVDSLIQSYNHFQTIFDTNNLDAEHDITKTIENLNSAINAKDGIIDKLNSIITDPDNALSKSKYLLEFSNWKQDENGLASLVGRIDNQDAIISKLEQTSNGISTTVTDLTTKGVLACMTFDADNGLTIKTPKKTSSEGGDPQARIVIDGDSVEGFSGNDVRQFMIGNDGVECQKLVVNGTTTVKNGLKFNYIKLKDYVAPTADANGNKINGLDFVKNDITFVL